MGECSNCLIETSEDFCSIECQREFELEFAPGFGIVLEEKQEVIYAKGLFGATTVEFIKE